MKHHEDISCIAALDAMDRHRRHVAIAHLVGAAIRNIGWLALGALLTFAAMKSNAQRFSPAEHPLPPNAPHLSPADTLIGADPKRFEQVPEPSTLAQLTAAAGMLFAVGLAWQIIKDNK